jgi:hypothetical protein
MIKSIIPTARALASFPLVNLLWCLIWCLPVFCLWFLIAGFYEINKQSQIK